MRGRGLPAAMIKTISKVGNSHMLIFDKELRDLAGIKVGDQVDVTVDKDGAITLTPIGRKSEPEVGDAANKR